MLTLTFIIGAVLSIVLYHYMKHAYFTLRGSLPGLPPQFLFGNMLQTGIIGRQMPMNIIFLQLKDKLGDVFQFWFGPMRIIVVSCLEDVQHIFAHRHVYDQGDMFINILNLVNPNAIIGLKGLCLKGEQMHRVLHYNPAGITLEVGKANEWAIPEYSAPDERAKFKRHTTIISPLFRRAKISAHLDTIIDCTDKLLNRWRNYNNDPTQIHLNLIEQSQHLLLSIFGFVAFDYDLQTLDEEDKNNQNELTHALRTNLKTSLILARFPIIIGRIYLLLNLEYRRARATIDRYLQQMIDQELRETPETRAERKKTSLIASLVASLQQDEKFEATKSEEDKKGLSRTEVMGEMLALLSAGYSTTSAALVWFIHLMSKHPHVQSKLKNELAEYNLQQLSVEQLDSLIYLDCVFRELFRFVPPIAGTLRTLTADDRLPTTGFQLSKGDQVFIPFYNLGRDSRIWSGSTDLDQFHPERFLIESNENITKTAQMAFGGGHRQCIGQDFARLEFKAICARLMQHVTFGDGGPEVNEGGYLQTDTILPKHIGCTIKFD